MPNSVDLSIDFNMVLFRKAGVNGLSHLTYFLT